jgi:outer membrane murein-binding lipoprotein Lpp
MADSVVTNQSQLIALLADSKLVTHVSKEITKTYFTTEITLARAIQDALSSEGHTVDLGLIKDFIGNRHLLLTHLPEVAQQWERLNKTKGEKTKVEDVSPDILESNPTEDFLGDIRLNAADPFRAMRSFADKFSRAEINQFGGSFRLNAARTTESYRALGEYYTGRLEKTINNTSQTFKSLESRASVYGEVSGYYSRATELDYFSMFTQGERGKQGFKGSFFQLQEVSTLSALYNREGKTEVATQVLTAADYNDERIDSPVNSIRQMAAKQIKKKIDILAANTISQNLAYRYKDKTNLEVSGVTMAEGSIHAKIGYFYDKGEDDVTGFLVSTQNITPTLSKTTTVEDMLLINRPNQREGEGDDTYNMRLASYNKLAKQVKAASDAMLSLMSTKEGNLYDQFNRSKQFITEFTERIGDQLQRGVRETEGGVFANHEILPALKGIIKSAAESETKHVTMSMQYLEKALLERNVLGEDTFKDLETLAKDNRLRIGVSAGSIGDTQGLYYMLSTLDRMEDGESKDFIKSLIKNDSFTILPTQLQHSKSLAVFDREKDSDRFNLIEYFLGSANISKAGMADIGGTTTNIEVSMLVKGDYLDLLSNEDKEGITSNYLYGIGRNFSEGSRTQGMLIERRGDAKQVNNAISMLNALGALDRQDPNNKDKTGRLSFSRRYILDKDAEAGYRLTGIDVTIGDESKGERTYSLGFTVGTERKFVRNQDGIGKVQEVPVLYINKTQRILGGLIYKNEAPRTLHFQQFNLETGKVKTKELKQGESYLANAIDILGGLVSTMDSSMKYDANVRSLVSTYKNIDQKDIRYGIDRMLAETIQVAFTSLNNKKLNVNGLDLIDTIGALRRLSDKDAKQVLVKVSRILNVSNTEGIHGKQAESIRGQEIDKIIRNIYSGLSSDRGTEHLTTDITEQFYGLIRSSLGLANLDEPKANQFTQMFSDLAITALKHSEVGYRTYIKEIEEGRGQIYHRMVDAFQQPHTQNYSQGQALHALPVYGLTNVVDNRLAAFIQEKTGLILNPYSLMHGETLGTMKDSQGNIIQGEYLRGIQKGAGRAETEQYYEAYGGLQKIEGGAPVVHDAFGLAQSMPTLQAVTRKEFRKRTLDMLRALGTAEADNIASLLTSTTFDKVNSEGKSGEDIENQILYYFPYAKTEQISQRMGNLTSTRPMFDASNSFIKYALSFGAYGRYNQFKEDRTKIIDGALPGSLPVQQFEALQQEKKARGEDVSYLEIAKEWSMQDEGLGKGFLGSERPRLISIIMGATQLSDYGIYNPEYNKGDESQGLYEQGMKYLKPHRVQVNGTLSSTRTSPIDLARKVQEVLKPGTIFIARDRAVESKDLLNKFAEDIQVLLKSQFATAANADTSDWKIDYTDLTEEGLIAKAKGLRDLLENKSDITDSDLFRAVTETLNVFKKYHKSVSIGYENNLGNKKINFKIRKGVYSPTDFSEKSGVYTPADPSQEIRGLNNTLVSIGDVEPGDAQFTLRAFSFFDGNSEYKVGPMKIAIPAHSARELNAYSVLGHVALNSNANNTFLLDVETYTVEDFMSGMRAGTILPKGPFRGGRKELFETLANIYEGVPTNLLPSHMQRKNISGETQRISAEDIFAYVSSSQIKGFNFELGLGLLSGGEKGSGALLKRMRSGTEIAQSLALMFIDAKGSTIGGDNNKRLLLSRLASSLEKSGDQQQFATALKIRAGNQPISDKFTSFSATPGISGLSIFSGLASLVSIDKEESLESALLKTVIEALGNEEAAKELGNRSSNLLEYLFKAENKLYITDEGSDKFTFKDTFETKPIGLLAFLAKASSDIYADIKLDDDKNSRYNIGGLGEAVMDSRNIFEDTSLLDNTEDKLSGVLRILSRVTGDSSIGGQYQLGHRRRALYTELIKLQQATKGNLDKAFTVHNMLSSANLDMYTNDFIKLLQSEVPEDRMLALEDLANTDSVARKVAYMKSNDANIRLVTEEYSHGSSIYELATVNYTEKISKRLGKPITQREALSLLEKTENNAEFFTFRAALAEELQKLNAQVGEPNEVLNKLMQTSNNLFGIEGGLSESDIRDYMSILNNGDPLSQAKKKGTSGYYSALEAYAGLAGPVLENAQRTMARAFGIILPDQIKIQEILKRAHAGQTLTDSEVRLLKETEFSLGSIRDAIQQQRAVLMPAEFAMSKIATPTGSKNVTALEGHLARSMTKRQLDLYTYSPNEYTDVSSVQEALFVLARIYEGTLTTDKQITSKYQLKLHNLGFGAIAPLLDTSGESRKTVNKINKVKALHKTEASVVDFLVNYNSMFRKSLPGEDVNIDAGVELLYKLTEGDETTVKEHMEKVNQITLGEVSSASMSFEEQIQRRTYLLAEYIYDQRGGHKVLERKVDEQLGKFTNLASTKSVKSEQYIEELKAKTERTPEEERILRLWDTYLKTNNYEEIVKEEKSIMMRQGRETEIERLSSLGGLRKKIEHVQSTNEGNAYLEAMKSLYTVATEQAKYSPNSKIRSEAERQKTLLKQSRFIALPNYSLVSSDFEGNLVLKHRSTSSGQVGMSTGVILGLDVLEKMSLLFQTDSHPALKAQHQLIKQLSKTQKIIDRVEKEMLSTGKVTVTQEEYQELQTLEDLMAASKLTTLDIMQNKNSIRQSTANRLNMMGASYIAVNSLLVGQDEVALGSRAERHSGSETTGGTLRFTGSARPSYKELEELMYDPSGFKFLSIAQKQVANIQEKAATLVENDPTRIRLEAKAQAWNTILDSNRQSRLTTINNRIEELNAEKESLQAKIDEAKANNGGAETLQIRNWMENISDIETDSKNLTVAQELAAKSENLVWKHSNTLSWDQYKIMSGMRDKIEKTRLWAESNTAKNPGLDRLADLSNRLLNNEESFDRQTYLEWQAEVKRVSNLKGHQGNALNAHGLTQADSKSELNKIKKRAKSNLKSWQNDLTYLQQLQAKQPNAKIKGKTIQSIINNKLSNPVLTPYIMGEDNDAIRAKATSIIAWMNKAEQNLNILTTEQQDIFRQARTSMYTAASSLLNAGNPSGSEAYVELDVYRRFNIELSSFQSKIKSFTIDYKELVDDGMYKKFNAIEKTLRMGVLELSPVNRLKRIEIDAKMLKSYEADIIKYQTKRDKLEKNKDIIKATNLREENISLQRNLKQQETELRKLNDKILSIKPGTEEFTAILLEQVQLDTKIAETRNKLKTTQVALGKVLQKDINGKTVEHRLLLLEGGINKTGEYISSYNEQISNLSQKRDALKSKFESIEKLNQWVSRLQDLAKAYGNKDYKNINSSYVIQKLESSGVRMDLFELEIITGSRVLSKDKRDILAEVDRKALQAGMQIGRSGALYGSFDSSRGGAAGITGVNPITADEMYNSRIRETGSLFGTDTNSSATLMMISAFGFQYVGLGDFDGDSYQAALTSVTKIRGNIARLTEEERDLQRTIAGLKKAKSTAINKEEKTKLNREIHTYQARLKTKSEEKAEAEKKLNTVRQQSRESTVNSMDEARKGIRAYTMDYLALPGYLFGSNEDGDKFAFKDSDLAGLVKQFRDTLGGLYDRSGDTDNVVGGFAYIRQAKEGEDKLANTNFTVDKEALIAEKGQVEAARLVDAIGTWHSRYVEHKAEDIKLEELSLEEYQKQMVRWVPQVESVYMTISTAGKILKNSSGSQISSTDLHSIQSLMGQTGGGLLGKVYNTIVPSVTGRIGDHLMNRLMSDEVSQDALTNAVDAQLRAKPSANQKTASSKDYTYTTEVNEVLKNIKKRTTGSTPWASVQKKGEKDASTAYRFLLGIQQFLRDAALKPKEGAGLVAATGNFKLSDQAKKLIADKGIKGLTVESLSKLKGYDSILALENVAREHKNGRDFLEIVSQDFLGSAANTVLTDLYGENESKPVDESMTAFAMLRLITDYAGGNSKNMAEMFDADKYLYAPALLQAHERLSEGKTNHTREDTVKQVITSLLGKFQSNFIVSSVMEGGKGITIDQTEKTLLAHKIELKVKDGVYSLDTESEKATKGGKQNITNQVQEDLNAYNQVENKNLTIGEWVKLDQGKEKLYEYTKEVNTVQGKLITHLEKTVEEVNKDIKAGKITSQEANKRITETTFKTIVEHTTGEQGEALIEQLSKLREFNKTVAEIKEFGDTSETRSHLFEALHAANVGAQQALLEDAAVTGIFSKELQASTYATDTGKLTNENLYRAFSTGILAVTDAVQKQVDNGSISESEAKGVFSYLAMGGMLPEAIQKSYEEQEAEIRKRFGNNEERADEAIGKFRVSFLKTLAASNGETPSILETIAQNSGYVAATANWRSIAEQSNAMLDNADNLTAEEQKQYLDLAKTSISKLEEIEQQQLAASGKLSSTQPSVELPKLPDTTTSQLPGEAPSLPNPTQTPEEVNKVVTPPSLDMGGTPSPEQVSVPTSTPDIAGIGKTTAKPVSTAGAPNNPAFMDAEGNSIQSSQMWNDVETAQVAIHNLGRKVQNRWEVEEAVANRKKRDSTLRRTFSIAEGLSILAVPTIFAAIQGDIPLGEQIQGLASGTAQSLLTMGSFKESTINSMAKGDIAGLERMQKAAAKLEHARMRDYFRYYDSPTEALARSFGNELMIRGMGAIGNELGTLFDITRGIDPLLASETGAGRLITEVAAGMIGKVVSGALTGAPVGNYSSTQTDITQAIMENAAKSVQTIQNYIMDNLSNIASDMDDDFNLWVGQEEENSTTVALDNRSSGDNFNPETKVALDATEFVQVVQIGEESVSLAQELGLINYDAEPYV